jgi:ligand-binding sensor domain-containing protein
MIRSFILCCLLWPCIHLHALQLSYKHYTVADGLPHSVVFRSFQDSRGIMWFGTDYGLSRFDGKRFKTYYTADPSLFNSVLSVVENDHRELIVAFYKQALYTISSVRPDSVRLLPLVNAAAVPRRIIQLLYAGGKLWSLDHDGATGFMDNGIYTSVVLPAMVHKLRMIEGVLVFATDKGMYTWNGAAAVPMTATTQTVYDMDKDATGQLWAGSRNKLLCYREGKLLKEYMFGNDKVQSVYCDRSGRTWICTVREGLFYISKGRVVKLSGEPAMQKIVANDIREDREGNIWVASYGDGVYCFYNRFMQNYTVSEGLADNYITTVAEDRNGTIWAGSLTSLHHLQHNRITGIDLKDYTPGIPLKTIMHKPPGKYVFGTFSNTIITDNNLRTVWKIDSSGTASWTNKKGEVYIGSYGVIYRLDIDAHAYTSFFLRAYNQRVNKMLEDAAGNTWIATDSGLVKTNDWKRFRYFYKHNGLPANSINDICLDNEGRLWLATENGLCCMEGDRITKIYTALSGMSHAKTHAVVWDQLRKGLWIATIRGVNFFDGRHFVHINTEQGLPSDEINNLMLDSKGYVWIGTVNGLSRMDPGILHLGHKPLYAYIDEVAVSHTSLFPDPDSVYNLSGRSHTFTVYIASAEYVNSGTLSYSYRLNNDPWNETEHAQVTFANLQPGSYVLYVRAKSKTADWSLPSVWHFVIHPPFWRTWWFTWAAALLAGIMLWLLLRWRIRTVRQRESEKLSLYKKIQTLKQQSLTSLLSPHFVFNALNSIQHYIGMFDKRSANDYLANFAQLIRKTMDDASQVFIPLRDELDHLELYLGLEQLRFGDKLQYVINVDEEIDRDEVFVPSLLIQPYVENAVWHGLMNKPGGGKVSVSVSRGDDDYLRILIEDDGMGMKQEPGGTKEYTKPRGTKIMEQRLNLLSGIIERPIVLDVRAGAGGTGTVVEIRIPADTVPLEEERA